MKINDEGLTVLVKWYMMSSPSTSCGWTSEAGEQTLS